MLATSVAAVLSRGSLFVLLWISTISPELFGKPELSRVVCARRLSPSRLLAASGFFWPSDMPATSTIAMNASQPTMAVLRWRALQCPARAARPLGLGVKTVPLRGFVVCPGRIGLRRRRFGRGGRRVGGPAQPPPGCGCPPATVRSSSWRWHRAGSRTRSSWSSRRSHGSGAAMTPPRSIATSSSWRRCSARAATCSCGASWSGARPSCAASSRRPRWRPRRPSRARG